MEKRKWIYHVLIFLVLASCAKSKVNTNHLGKQGKWSVNVLDLGLNSNSPLPRLKFEESIDPEIYTAGVWKHEDHSEATFKWRFNYFSGSFTLMIDETAAQDVESKAFLQCSNLSGEYFILTEKKKLFEFEAISTKGYGEIPVFIQLIPA